MFLTTIVQARVIIMMLRSSDGVIVVVFCALGNAIIGHIVLSDVHYGGESGR